MDIYWIDLVVILLYAVTVVYNGVKNVTGERYFEYYAFGRNKLSSTSIAYSMVTALIGANFIISNLSGYSMGMCYLIASFVGEFCSFFIWGKVLSLKGIANSKYLSVCDTIEDMYGKKAAIISGVIATLSSLLSVALQLFICCDFLERCMGINKLLTCVFLCVLMLFYVTFFGIDSITRTNIFQVATMVVVFPILINIVFADVIDVDNFLDSVKTINNLDSFGNVEISNMLMIIFSLGCCPPVVHRRFIASSGSQFYNAMKKTCICVVIFQLFFMFLGACCAYVYTGNISISGDVITNLVQKMPHFFKGIVLAGMISIVLSSVDAHTHTGVVSFMYDVVRRFKGDIRSHNDFLLRYARIGVVVFLVIATFMAVILGKVGFIMRLRVFWCFMVMIPTFIGIILLNKPNYMSWWVNILLFLLSYTLFDICNIKNLSSNDNMLLACFIGVFGFILVYVYNLYKKHNLKSFCKNMFLFLYEKCIKTSYEWVRFFILEKLRSCNYYRYTKRKFDTAGINSTAFAVIMTCDIFFSSFISTDCEEDMYNACILIKFIISLLTLMSVMYKYMPSFYVRNRWIFFIITLMICGPIYSFVFVGITNGEWYWHIYTMINIILIAFIIDWLNFFIILVGGFFLAEFILHRSLAINADLLGMMSCNIEICVLYILSMCICLVIFYGKKFLTEYTNINAYKASVGIISHETVTPLMLINNKLKKIMKIDLTSDDIREKLKKLASEGILFVNSIFSFYDLFLKNIISFGGDSSKIKVIEVSAKTVVKHIMSLYPLNDNQKNIIKMDLEDDFMIAVNVMLLKHIIHNVVRNALFFVSGSENPSISIRLEKHTYKSYNHIEISDNGVGMNSSTANNVFQKFYTKRINGAGLGLYFCKNAMYSMMGDISVDSAVGRGSTFALMFPHSDMVENVIKWDGDISSLC